MVRYWPCFCRFSYDLWASNFKSPEFINRPLMGCTRTMKCRCVFGSDSAQMIVCYGNKFTKKSSCNKRRSSLWTLYGRQIAQQIGLLTASDVLNLRRAWNPPISSTNWNKNRSELIHRINRTESELKWIFFDKEIDREIGDFELEAGLIWSTFRPHRAVFWIQQSVQFGRELSTKQSGSFNSVTVKFTVWNFQCKVLKCVN